MELKSLLIAAALFLGGGTVLGAPQTQPASAPALDWSTPRGALRLLNAAMRGGDASTIERALLAENPAEVRMVKADAEMAAALADLRGAAAAAYGEDGASTVTGDSTAGATDSIARIDAADIVVKGDTATVTYRDEKESPFVLRKVGGEWKVPVAQLGKPLDRPALDQRLNDLAAQRQVVEEVTRQIRAGAFAAADQAREAWRSRILQAATSQPIEQGKN